MPASTPLVSVVIPCFNCAASVTETLDSVARQTWSNLEIVAVDDQSRDDTLAVLKAYAEREPRLRIIVKKNAGCGAARNTGIAASHGSFVGLIDADDLWAPTYIERHMARFAVEPDLGVSFTRVRYIAHDGRDTGEATNPKLDRISAQDILEANPCGCAMMVARRAVFAQVGAFNPALRRAEDQDWLFRVALTRWQIRGIGETLADYRNSPDGLSADLDAQLAAYLDLLGHVREIAPGVVDAGRRRAVAGMLHYIARRAIRLGEDESAVRSYLWRALKMAPELLVEKPKSTLAMLVACVSLKGFRQLQQMVPGAHA